MNDDEHDDLWQLLGKARTPVVSPFFSRNVLRDLRAAPGERSGVLIWIFARWKFSVLAAVVVALASVGAWQHLDRRPTTIAELAQKVSASPDYAVISHLDELLASEETSVWLDNPRF